MSISAFLRLINLPDKPAWSQSFITVDISQWLLTDTIFSVDWSAICEDTGERATSTILDTLKCTTVGSYLKPYIRGGQPGYTYLITMLVTTTGGDREAWYLRVPIAGYLEPLKLGVGLDAILVSS